MANDINHVTIGRLTRDAEIFADRDVRGNG